MRVGVALPGWRAKIRDALQETQALAETETCGGEHCVAAIAGAAIQPFTAQQSIVFAWPMTGSSTVRRLSQRLILKVTPRLCPVMYNAVRG